MTQMKKGRGTDRMNPSWNWLWLVVTIAWLTAAIIPTFAQEPEVTYHAHVEPVFKRSCVACHHAGKSEGNLSLESLDAIQKGGDSGPLFTSAALDESELLVRVTAMDDRHMPPKSNSVGATSLSESEIAILRRWVELGAPAGTPADMRSKNWQSVPTSLQPIYTTAASPDDQWVACGRANLAYLYRLDQDANVLESMVLRQVPDQPTHLDLIQSVAFSPDGSLLATGAYREVKTWKRHLEPSAEAPAEYAGMEKIVARRKDHEHIAFARTDWTIDIVNSQSRQVQKKLSGLQAPVTAMAWTTDHSFLISADQSGHIIAWDLSTPEFELPLESSQARGHAIAANSVGESRSLVALAETQVLELTDTGELRRWTITKDGDTRSLASETLPLNIEGLAIRRVATTEPKIILIARENGSILWIDTENGNAIRECSHGAAIHDMTVSADGSKIATAGADGTIKLWNYADGQHVQTLHGEWQLNKTIERRERDVRRKQLAMERMVALLPELEKAHVAEVEAEKKFLETLDKASENSQAKTQAFEQARVALDEHDKLIAETQSQLEETMKRLEQLRAEREAKVTMMQQAEKAKEEAETAQRIADQALANARMSVERAAQAIPMLQQQVESAKARIETATTLTEEARKNATASDVPVLQVAFGPQDRTVVAAFEDLSIRTYRVADGTPLERWESLRGAPSKLWYDDHGWICATLVDGAPQFWNTNHSWRFDRAIGSVDVDIFPDRITALDFSPDGRLLAVGSGEPSRTGDLCIIATDTGAIVKRAELAHSDTILGLAFSPDGTQIASCGADKMAKVWNVDTLELERTLEGHTHHVLAVAWQDDGMTLATGSADNTIKIWDATSGESRRTIAGFPKEITGLRFHGTSSMVISSCADSQVRMHDASNGNGIRSFGGAADFLYSLTTSIKERFVISGGQDGVLRAWNVENAQLVQQIR